METVSQNAPKLSSLTNSIKKPQVTSPKINPKYAEIEIIDDTPPQTAKKLTENEKILQSGSTMQDSAEAGIVRKTAFEANAQDASLVE